MQEGRHCPWKEKREMRKDTSSHNRSVFSAKLKHKSRGAEMDRDLRVWGWGGNLVAGPMSRVSVPQEARLEAPGKAVLLDLASVLHTCSCPES